MYRESQSYDNRRSYRRQTSTAAAAAIALAEPSGRSTLLRIAHLLFSKDPRIRLDAINNLKQIGTRDVIPYLCQALNDRDPQIRTETALALGKLRALTAKEKLYDLLNDRNHQVRCAAARALFDMGDKFGLPYVIKLVCTKGDHQLDALRTLRHLTNQKFPITPRGLKEALRWLKLRDPNKMRRK